jgi:polysaccharide export outer membrane protein
MRIHITHPARFTAALLVAVAAAIVCAAPCLATQDPAPSVQQDQAHALEGCMASYLIGPEDVLDISVWKNTDISRTVPVRPDGKISLPLLNDVQAAGLSPMQLRDGLTKALAAFMPEPHVSVLVHEIHSFKVTVIGQVKTPGRYELKDRATVLDVLALAGGPTEYAARSRIAVVRHDQAATVQIPFSYDRLMAKAGSRSDNPENFCVKPGDVILVP